MDFLSSPLNRKIYPIANVLSSFVIGVTISLIAFCVYWGIITARTGHTFSAEQCVKCVLIICIAAMMNAALMGFIVSFLRTNGAFSSVSLVIGTVIGFLNGLYVPLGSLPNNVQNFIQILPFMHIASLFRQVLTSGATKICYEEIGNEALLVYQKNYGITLDFGGGAISVETSLLYIISFMAIAMTCFFTNYGRKKKYI